MNENTPADAGASVCLFAKHTLFLYISNGLSISSKGGGMGTGVTFDNGIPEDDQRLAVGLDCRKTGGESESAARSFDGYELSTIRYLRYLVAEGFFLSAGTFIGLLPLCDVPVPARVRNESDKGERVMFAERPCLTHLEYAAAKVVRISPQTLLEGLCRLFSNRHLLPNENDRNNRTWILSPELQAAIYAKDDPA
jgi:hypothetical protein